MFVEIKYLHASSLDPKSLILPAFFFLSSPRKPIAVIPLPLGYGATKSAEWPHQFHLWGRQLHRGQLGPPTCLLCPVLLCAHPCHCLWQWSGVCGCAKGTGPADHHQLPGGEPGCGGLAGGHLGDALGGVPGGKWAQVWAAHVTVLVFVFPELLAFWAQNAFFCDMGTGKEGELLSFYLLWGSWGSEEQTLSSITTHAHQNQGAGNDSVSSIQVTRLEW